MRGAGPFIVLAVVLMTQPMVLACVLFAYIAVLILRTWE